jgi:threonine dehydrogenase-like Zn-dependent dehydrogenase
MVLVKSLACGICGSDLHARKHAHRMVELAKHFPGRKPMDLSRDVVFGHEFCCEVLDYGPDTTGKLRPGTKVCSLPALLTAEGPQGIGYSNDNVGAYAERMLLSEALLLEVPNGLAAEHAALTEPLAVGVHAVAKANIRGGEVPLVIGCGPVGLAAIAALRMKGLIQSSPPIIHRRGGCSPRKWAPISWSIRHARSPTPPGPSMRRCRRRKKPRARRCRHCCRR